ncbi:MAG: hypothetical protein EBU04_09440, partial [Verrucomicrobia bacterium]|nr:hypothetical protein [Verrucomicrobiota bacterium]
MTLGGTTATATAAFNSITNPLRIGQNTGTTSTATGTLNISGSAVTVAANGTTAIKLGDASVAGGTAAGTLNITGGSLTVAGNIIRGAIVGTSTAVLNLDGGILDMGGFKIGGPSSATGNLTATTFASGTLSNVADINFGSGLTKTTAGTLTLTGNNTFGGPITVSAGILALNDSRLAANTVGVIQVGNTASTAATLNIINGAIVSSTGFYLAGTAALTGITGTVNQTGGSVNLSGTLQLLMGNGTAGGNTANYNLSAGSLTAGSVAQAATRGVLLGTNSSNTSTFTLSGSGVLNLTTASGALADSSLLIGRYDLGANNATNTFAQTGGTANIGNLSIGGNAATTTGGTHTLSLSGGTFVANTFPHLAEGNSNVAVINISGTADVTLPAFPTTRGTSATATLNLDGGTLRPLAASATYLGGLTNAFIKSGGATFNVASSKDITVTQALLTHAVSTGGGLTKQGVGTLTLTGGNTYTGATTVSAGTLSASDGSLAGTSSIAVNGTATLSAVNYNSAATLSVAASGGTATISGQGLSLAGVTNAGTVNFNNASGTTTLATLAGAGTTNFSGNATITGDITNSSVTIASGKILTLNSGSTSGSITGAGGLTKTGNGTLTLSGANSYTGVTTLNGGTISVDSLGTGSGTSALGASTLTDVTKLVISGATINYTGTGGTYARSLTVGDGTFGLANNGSGALVLSNAANIDFADTVGADRILSLSGANEGNNIFAAATADINDVDAARVFSQIIKDGVGTWILSGPKNRFRGDIRINGGTLGFETGSLPDNQRISMADGAVLRWEAGNTDDISGKLNPDASSNVVLKVNGGSVTFAMDMIFVGTGATANSATARVTKSGASDLEITHSQSFTGGFTINAGKLIASAAGSLGTGKAIVNSGGTLAANGNNSGADVDVNSGGTLMGTGTGGTLAPGASPGTLIADSLVLGANSNFQWQVHDAAGVAGTGWDKIMVTNNLDLSGVSSVGTRISINVMSLHDANATVTGNAVNWSKDDIHTLLFGHVGGITWNDVRGQNIADYFSFDTSAFTTSDSTGIHNSLWSMSYDSISGDITLTAVP